MDNISMTKQQQCGNVDEGLLDIDPPILNMLRSVINYARLPNITLVGKNGFLPGKVISGYSAFARPDLPY